MSGGYAVADSLGTMLAERARSHPERPVLRAHTVRGPFTTLTYAELDELSTRLARGLVSLGVKRGGPVAFLFSNFAGVEAVATYCAIHKAGGAAVPINARFVAREITSVVEHSRIETFLYEQRFAQLVADAVAPAERPVTLVQAGREPGDASDWHALLDAGSGVELAAIGRDDMADWLYTSGTTGRPKCAMLTHHNCLAAGGSLAGCFRLKPGDVHLTASPFFTSSGCHTSLLSSVTAGATYVMATSTRAEDMLELIQAERATVVGAVPSVFAYICNSPHLADADLERVKLVYHGGAAVNAGLVLQIQQAFPNAEVINVYGQTESGNPGTVLRGDWSVEKAGSIGKSGMPDVEVRVLAEDGTVLEGPGLGEVCLRSEAVMVGYLADPAETANVLKDGWLLTGDLVRVDKDGFMFVYDRKKDVIIRGGHNVASIEVESTLNEHPAVIESAVVGKPHPSLGEDLKAFVVLTEPGAVDADDLRDFCAVRLADYKVPRDFTFLDELPRNPTGKVLKRELRDQLTGAGK